MTAKLMKAKECFVNTEEDILGEDISCRKIGERICIIYSDVFGLV